MRKHDVDTGSVTKELTKGPYLYIPEIDGNDRLFARNSSTEGILRWDPSSDSTSTIYNHVGDYDDLRELDEYNGDIYIAKESGSISQIERRQTDNTLVWETDIGSGFPNFDVTSDAIYMSNVSTLERRTHSGTLEWEQSTDGLSYIDTQNDTYIHLTDGLDIEQYYQANGTKTSFSYEADYSPKNIETGPEGYVYIDDKRKLTVLDPADGSVVLQRSFTGYVGDIEVRSNYVYLETDQKNF